MQKEWGQSLPPEPSDCAQRENEEENKPKKKKKSKGEINGQ